MAEKLEDFITQFLSSSPGMVYFLNKSDVIKVLASAIEIWMKENGYKRAKEIDLDK